MDRTVMDNTPADQSAEDPDLVAIRRIMESQPARTPRAVRQLVDDTDTDTRHNSPGSTRDLIRTQGHRDPETVYTHHPETTETPRRNWLALPRIDLAGYVGRGLKFLLRHIRAFLARPDAPRLLAIAVLAVIVVLWPLAVLSMVLIVLALAAITWFSLGPDRASEMILNWYWRLHARDPDRAEALRARAAGLSARLARLLERLPNRWTQGLYLPTFEEPSPDVYEDDTDPFERLVAQRDLR